MDKRRGELSVGELVAAENLWIQEAPTELKTQSSYAQVTTVCELLRWRVS